MLRRVAVCYSVLQYITVSCSVLQCAVVYLVTLDRERLQQPVNLLGTRERMLS